MKIKKCILNPLTLISTSIQPRVIRHIIAKNLPTSVVHRIRRNCSDNVKNDQLFKDTLVEYKSYIMKSGYEEEHINSKFVRFGS